ncbi:MAG TPA: hypothetical protein VNL91_02190, partial [Thermoanaerobaculia bacterium]|nr:hypothetical protein [Thermoanaerobaculia bacterium]
MSSEAGGLLLDRRRRVVRVGILNPIVEIDPRQAYETISGLVLGQVFETPYVLMAGETRPKPHLFDGMLQAEGERVYSAGVREGIFFSDGTPLTAEA